MSLSEANVKVNVLEKTASKDESLSVLLELCDEDFNGNNGKDYTYPEALEAGYESTAAYYFDAALQEGKSYIQAIECVLKTQYEGDSYYCNYAIEILDHDTCYFIATTHVAQ